MSDTDYVDYENSHSTWDHARFIGKMISATKNHAIPMSDLPQSINLDGKLGNILDELIVDTLRDPARRERGKVAKVDFNNKIRIPQEITVGEEDTVALSTARYIKHDLSNPQYSHAEHNAFDMHTHGTADVPPSPRDFTPLFIDPEDGGMQSIIVGTESSKFLVVKTLLTPTMSPTQAAELTGEWRKDIRLDIRVMSMTSPNPDKYAARNMQHQMKFVLDTCHYYGMGLYIANNRSNNFKIVRS